MHCVLCQRLTCRVICESCKEIYLKPNPSTRTLENGLHVVSFYKYSDIAPLLQTKHTLIGSKVFEILAEASFKKFASSFCEKALAVPIDDHTRSGYSHTAILTNALKSDFIKPLFGKLRATNHETYSGKTLMWRKANKRAFTCSVPKDEDVILVDDLITTGQTLLEASSLLEKIGINTLFALTLANAKEN